MKRHLRPVASLSEEQGEITPSFVRSPAYLKLPMMLLCKGTCAPVAPPFKGQEGIVPVMHPRSGVPGKNYLYFRINASNVGILH